MLDIAVFCGIAVVVVLFILSDVRKPAKYPPGPPWLPIIGNWLLFRKYIKDTKFTHIAWQRFAEEYGPLVGLRLGKDHIVIVSEYKLAKDILSREEFEGRPDGFIFRLRSMGKRLGVAFVDGAYGLEQRRFCLKHLREFSLGSSIMEHKISEETSNLVDWLKVQVGPVDLQPVLDMCILNNLWSALTGNRYSLSDSRLSKLIHHIHTLFQLQDMSGGLLNQMPFLRFLPPEKNAYNQLLHIHNEIWNFLRETINDHKRVLVNGTSDYIDAFLHEMRHNNSNSDSTFTEEQLLMTLFDLFMAGSDTTSNTLMFIIIYLLRYPEVQAKAQAELDTVVGWNTKPTLAHRPRLCYVEAIIMEVQRIANVAPMTAAHRAKTDAMVQEFVIPQDTVVLISLYSIHMDKDYWGDPDIFRPERFLDKEGHLVQSDRLIPFSYGRRRCLGETLARANLFLFLTALLQNFTILLSPGGKIPDVHVIDGSVLAPTKFGGCIFKARI